jgi:O-succinylbenzoate synthase
MLETIRIADLPTRWAEISTALRSGEREFAVTEGRQVRAVIVDPVRYRRLTALAEREERRRRALALPTAATSQADWDAGFATLERVSEKFTGVSDDDLDTLFGEALAEVRTTGAIPA